MAEMQPVRLPSVNEARLQAWATSPMEGTFFDPVDPALSTYATIGAALRSLSQEVLALRAEIALLRAERDG